MGLNRELLQKWNAILCEENLGLIESNNKIFPETIIMNHRMILLRDTAREWVNNFDESRLEKIRWGEHRGSPNYLHRRVIELFADGLSTRDISNQLEVDSIKIGFQGVARIINRYLGKHNDRR